MLPTCAYEQEYEITAWVFMLAAFLGFELFGDTKSFVAGFVKELNAGSGRGLDPSRACLRKDRQ
jgi:hypothetical protein